MLKKYITEQISEDANLVSVREYTLPDDHNIVKAKKATGMLS